MWDNYDDARMRAVGCVVRYDGAPVYIHDITHDLNASVTNLLTQEAQAIKLSAKKWDWSPVNTGFVNMGPKCVYVYRRPVRKWKQGLHRDNCKMSFPNRDNRVHAGEMLKSREFGRTVAGDFPSFKKVFAAMVKGRDGKGRVESRAFSKEFGLTRSDLGLVWLLHRGKKVGWYEEEHLRLGEGCMHLIQSYEEVVA